MPSALLHRGLLGLYSERSDTVSRIKGIDVALYEPVIDWIKVRDAGYRFAFIKCSQSDYNDPKFIEHWKHSRGILPRGAYHFYDPRYVSPQKQAEKFFTSLGNDLGELPFVVDIELYTSGPYYGSRYWYDYMERLNQLSDNHPLIIYTAYYYWNENVYKYPSVVDVNYFKKYDLWDANYGVTYPSVPYPWTNWKFWQYSDKEMIDGVYDELGRITRCDADYFYGTEEEFNSYLLDNGEPEPMADYMELTSSVSGEWRSIREQTSYPQVPHIIGSFKVKLNLGNIAKSNPTDFYEYQADVIYNGLTQARAGDKWWKVYEANGVDTIGWIAEIHLGKRYLNTRLVTTTPPPVSHVVEVYIDGILEFRKELL